MLFNCLLNQRQNSGKMMSEVWTPLLRRFKRDNEHSMKQWQRFSLGVPTGEDDKEDEDQFANGVDNPYD
jgi:hypothetical protein